MSQLAIFYPLSVGVDNPVLRQISQPIDVIDSDVKDFGDVLLTLMYEYDGVGLAAPQLGKNIRMIAVTEWEEKKTTPRKGKQASHKKLVGERIMINPEILEYSTTTQITEEACLSVPKVFGDVKRYQRIKVKYQDSKGKIITKKLTGFNAVIVQHEIDHLNGILFVDKVIRFSKS
ncbi:MAG: peptide deformylase [Candidatus Peribacteria bacterium]|jgi:peptide deformylase|nr:peptide deformylase [Candidatus Peribacteria bacterium]